MQRGSILITQAELKRQLRYEPETGHFYWLEGGGRRRLGFPAGSLWSNGYARIWIDGKDYMAHRLAWLYMYGAFPQNQIDHINGNPLDNRILNLRDVDQAENHKNKRRQSNNSSGVTGVRWNKQAGKWVAYINVDGKQIYFGLFEDFFEAVCARKSAENKYGFHENHGRSGEEA